MKAQLDTTKQDLVTTKDELVTSQKKIVQLEAKADAQAKELTKMGGEKSSLEHTNASLAREIGALKKELAGAAEGIKSMTAMRDAIQAKLTEASKNFAHTIEQLAEPAPAKAAAEPDISLEI